MLRNGGARFARVWSIVLASSLLATAGWSQTLTWLGSPRGGNSYAYGVSADGSVVVGSAKNATGFYRAFRWQNRVMQGLGTLGGRESWARAVSADGSVVVGWAVDADGQFRAFRWESGVMQDLGTLGGPESVAYGVSADGSVVVGRSYKPDVGYRPFRWTRETGMQELGTLLEGIWLVEALAVSADGSVVVGDAYAGGQNRALRWENGVMQDLGSGGANGVSADGSVVVGWAGNSTQQVRAFRWQHGVMQDLGTLPGRTRSQALAVSADGSVVVGIAYNGYYRFEQVHAFRWTPNRGMEDLNQTYARLLTDGSVLMYARAISPNGRYIVGDGFNAATGRVEGFLLDTVPEPASLMALGAGLAGLLGLRRRKR